MAAGDASHYPLQVRRRVLARIVDDPPHVVVPVFPHSITGERCNILGEGDLRMLLYNVDVYLLFEIVLLDEDGGPSSIGSNSSSISRG